MSREKIKDISIAKLFSIVIVRSFILINFWILYNPIAPKVGIDSQKDIFAASDLSNWRNLAADIVIPDLLTPGINESIWTNPIINAHVKLKSDLIFFFCGS